jgi:hypothetical protein
MQEKTRRSLTEGAPEALDTDTKLYKVWDPVDPQSERISNMHAGSKMLSGGASKAREHPLPSPETDLRAGSGDMQKWRSYRFCEGF